ncbi:uncharacterized protein LOC119097864 [Pollicipes pollicipes]|uniref:uncharacterized protein LOC119097864 n=1 Tax=Pollicipes pollicipes TaxID=41117 RepID=UPI0018852536|nr:uncharacterized protein LOC119097864 [Pollicipes pollicipes]
MVKSEGIRAANKLSRLHVQYEKNKRKVKLAAQLFSSSVGKALLYLEESGHHEFIGVGATGRLILLVDQAFDYLNSSNPYVKVFKTPVAANNLISVLFRLQTASGEPVLQTRRFTPVLGLCLATQTVIDVSEALLKEGFVCVLPYKMSQDHLELLSGQIRRVGGFNNNPNVAQLQHAMRRLILHSFISPSATGSCMSRDDGDDGLLQIRPKRQRQTLSESDPMPAVVQHLITTEDTGSGFVDNCVGYISGYVCRKLVETSAIGCA